ncbi:MAG: nucleoside deaminase [Bacilli bacterium]
MKNNDIYFMRIALKEAQKAYKNDEIPVGAIIVDSKGDVLSKAFNKKEKMHDATAHAEILAIKKASKKLGDWRLNGCTIYVTLEPCEMCMSAIKQSRISKLVYGASKENINSNTYENKSMGDLHGILEKECLEIIQMFFEQKR